MPPHVFFSGDEGMKFIQVQSLVRQGWRASWLEYPGRELDPEFRFFPIPGFSFVLGDRVYFHFPITFSALSSLPYAVLGTRGLYLIPAVSTVLTAIVVYCWLSRWAPRWAVVSILLLSFGTPLFFYSLLFWEHTLTVLLTTVGVSLLSRRAVPPWQAAVAGMTLGLVCWLRSEFYLFALVVAGSWTAVRIFGVGSKRGAERVGAQPDPRKSWRPELVTLLGLGLGLVVVLIPLWVWQQAVYDRFLGPQLGWHVESSQQVSRTLTELSDNILGVSYTTLVQGYPGRNPTIFLAIAFDLMVVVLWLPRLRRRSWLILFAGALLTLASLPALVYANEHVIRGLLPVSPLIALSLVPLRREQNRERAELSTFLLLVILGYIVAVCVLGQIDPGLQWGPRFLLPLYPLLIVAALNSLTTLERSPTRKAIVVVFVALAVTSLVIQVAGIRLLYRNKQKSLDFWQGTVVLPVTHIVTEVSWYPPEVADLFYERQFFYAEKQTDFEGLMARFCQAGIEQFAWVPLERTNIDPEVVFADCSVEQRSDLVFEIVR
jgi:hypothetical protein